MFDTQLILGLLLTILPFIELRGGLPIIVNYALKQGLSVFPYFMIVLILNVVLIFFIFIFLDYFHGHFMKVRMYRLVMDRVLKSLWKKVDRVRSRMDAWGYIALMLLVAVPLPGTGAWTGSLVAWAMKLDRVKSFISIALGVIIAGILILFVSLGVLS
jgi:uncharacterized membrane protein